MNIQKMVGHVLYAIGIIGGVEGATMPRGMDAMTGILASVVAMVVIVIGAYLLEK